MNDEFLNQFRQQPGERFVRELHERISRSQSTSKLSILRSIALRPVVIAALAFLLTITALLAVSPSARAFVADILRIIGGIPFTETSQYPGGDGPAEIVPTKLMTLEEAQALLPYPILLPTWLPEGSAQFEHVRVSELPGELTIIEVEWEIVEPGAEISGMRSFGLTIFSSPEGFIVGPDAIEEVSIKGQTAALFRGGWNYNKREWDPSIGVVTLVWQIGEQEYVLQWPSHLTMGDMVHVAESIP
ncbi:MAG: hypothetical protein FJZ96_10955 [Chloroflexi bacterium]|nr:hypothetical protein [Chloroflexota bacterium]